MTNQTHLRIHPAIGMARVGNSEEYYLGPETMAGHAGENGMSGGLPIKPGTEKTTITSEDIRDGQGKLKRQAARFKIYQYQGDSGASYPSGAGEEVTIGSMVDGKKVVDIAWTVHLANKKANCWEIDEAANLGIILYEGDKTPPIRNPKFPPSENPAEENRLKKLVIDAGPRTILASSTAQGNATFDSNSTASYWDNDSGQITEVKHYPISFPASMGDGGDYSNASESITYLGEMMTEENGRLLVLGAYGKACGFDNSGRPDPNAALNKDVDNDNWLDDTADGPVTAVLIFEDGSRRALEGNAWVVSTDPAYAPQTLNVVSLWDDVYTTFLEQLGLDTDIYNKGAYQPDYKPHFQGEVHPILNSAHLQMYNTNLPKTAQKKHQMISQLTSSGPGFDIMSFIRTPDNDKQIEQGAPLMPLSLGDSAKSFLTVTTTQYFFLDQWNNKKVVDSPLKPLGPGEQLDKTILVNCLGGRFSPGIDLTFIVRDVNLYNQHWQNPDIGPFRINMKPLDYTKVSQGTPFLGVGYIPLRTDPVEPGDLCKFMAIPWHTDYNSCATHLPAPNPGGKVTEENVYSGTVNTSLFWSWPAQRPVAVYTFDDLKQQNGNLDNTIQRFSVRGEGTAAIVRPGGFNTKAENVGRYQERINILINWHRIGTVIQGGAIDNYPDGYDKDYLLEVQSQFDVDDSNLVEPWPNTVTDAVYPPKNNPGSGGSGGLRMED